jgi:hypothetical protein
MPKSKEPAVIKITSNIIKNFFIKNPPVFALILKLKSGQYKGLN